MKMKKLITVLTCVALGLFSSAGFAGKGLDYSYAEIGYVNIDSDAADGDGFGINTSYAALDNVHVKLGYARLFDDGPGEDLDVNRFTVGVGGNFSVAENVDLTGSLNYVDIEGTQSSNDKMDGYLVDIGIRAKVTKKVELNATVGSLHLEDEDNTGFSVGTVVKLHKKFSVTAKVSQFDADAGDDETEFFIGIRLSL